MTKPDDFTLTLLHKIQDARTAPGNGWMTALDMARATDVHDNEAFRLGAPLKELHKAGMIERRWNADRKVDEYRSIGVQPDIAHSIPHPDDDFADAVKYLAPKVDAALRHVDEDPLDPAPTTIFPVPLKDTVHAGFVLDYRTDKWATMCGRQVKDPSIIEHRRAPVQCRRCAEAVA